MRAALFLSAMLLAAPAAAQDHSQHAQPDQRQDPPVDHRSMDHSAHAMPAAPPPPEIGPGSGRPRAADAVWGAEAMRDSRAAFYREGGGQTFGQVLLERLELRAGKGDELYLWDLQAFWGSDLDKLVIKSEGEGAFGGEVESAEVQALWSLAIAPFFDLQAGARQDMQRGGRSHAVLGLQGLAPYMIHLDAAAFLSDKGDLTARIEAEHDWRITQDLILQPRAELNLSAQDIPLQQAGSGATSIEAGLRLRYHFAREFAPYLGVDYEARLGDTRDYARAAGEDPAGWRFLAGVRTWF